MPVDNHSFQPSRDRAASDDELKSVQPTASVKSDRDQLMDSTVEFWRNCGLTVLPRVSLLSDAPKNSGGAATDESVLFIGSNTNIIKNIITTGTLPENGLCTSQPKLRLMNYKALFTDEPISCASYFHSVGITFDRTNYARLVHTLDLYFKDILNLSRDKLVVTTYGEESLFKPWAELGYPVRTENCTEKFDWEFGVVGDDGRAKLVGRGIYFGILDQNGAPVGDFATLEEIRDVSKGVVAYEFGMGYEALLAVEQSSQATVRHPIAYSCLGCFIEPSEPNAQFLKVVDSLLVVLSILNEGAGLHRGDFSTQATYSFFRRFLRGLLFYSAQLGVPATQLERFVSHARDAEFSNIPDSKARQLLDTVAEYQTRQQFFHGRVAELVRGELTGAGLILPTVRRHVRAKTPIDVLDVADQSGIIAFERSDFFGGIRSSLVDGRYISTAELKERKGEVS
jgi:hypothetical protein